MRGERRIGGEKTEERQKKRRRRRVERSKGGGKSVTNERKERKKLILSRYLSFNLSIYPILPADPSTLLLLSSVSSSVMCSNGSVTVSSSLLTTHQIISPSTSFSAQ